MSAVDRRVARPLVLCREQARPAELESWADKLRAAAGLPPVVVPPLQKSVA